MRLERGERSKKQGVRKGSKVRKTWLRKGPTDKKTYRISANQVIPVFRSRPIRFFSGGKFNQSGFSSWKISQSADFSVSLSSNHISACWKPSQSGFFRLRVQSIKWFHHRTIVQSGFRAGSSANQVISLSGPYPIRFFHGRRSANQVISLSGPCPIRFFHGWRSANQVISSLGCRSIRFFRTGSSANQMISLSSSCFG